MSSHVFSIGDYVKIINESSPLKFSVGKIEEILIPPASNKIIRFTMFFFPEETREGRQEHNSVNELYSSSEIEKEVYSNIISKCEVLTYENYLKKRLSKNSKNVYFFRQKYIPETGNYQPDLDPSCYCNTIFNPDEDYSQCSKCKEFFHLSCFLKSGNKKCFNELCNNIIENQMTTTQLEQLKSNIPSLGNKRKRSEDIIKPQTEEKYKNLPEENRLYLINLIDNIEKLKNRKNVLMTETQKVRNNAKESLLFVLLYGVEELKVKKIDFWEKVNKQSGQKKLTKEALDDFNNIRKFCDTLSNEIEYCLFSSNKEIISNIYKRKLFTLITNLQDDRNTELRISILMGDITPMKLVEMNSDELAPSSVKKRRREQQNKYFKEQVYLDGEIKIIAKNHKGDTILSVDPKDKNNEGFISYTVLQKSNYERTQDLKDKDAEFSDGGSGDEIDGAIKKKEKKRQLAEIIQNKYKNLPPEKVRFYVDLEDCRREKIISKINKRITQNLKPETVQEMNELRKKFNIFSFKKN